MNDSTVFEAPGLRILSAEGGAFLENTFVVHCETTNRAVVVDPGASAPEVILWLDAQGVAPDAVWLTHAHLDHVEGIPALRARWPALPIWLHPADEGFYAAAPQQAAAFGLAFEVDALPTPTQPLAAGDLMTVGAQQFRVRFAPGHAPGHVMFVHEAAPNEAPNEAPAVGASGVALVGDVVFQGSIGRTDLPMGDFDTLMDSIRREVLSLPDAVVLLPGHGPATTVGFERTTNPFIAPQFGGPSRGFA